MNNTVFLLWLEGVEPEHLSQVPSLARLAASGVDVQLAPLPLAEKSVCYYETLTGMGPGKFGHYDAVRPLDYKPIANTTMPDGALGRLLPDIVRSRKLAITFLEGNNQAQLETLNGQKNACTLVRFSAEKARLEEIDTLVQHCIQLAGNDAHLLVLSDVWSAAPATFVNVNDFLADVGLLEVGEERSRDAVNWSETLAYGLGTGQVWINLRGREAQGIVTSGSEYQEVCDALVNELSVTWLDTRTHTPVVERVMKKEEAYTGNYVFNAPDLTLVYRPGYAPSPKAVALDFDGSSVFPANEQAPASATPPYARLIASGPSLASGQRANASLVDVMPTVLYLLQQPIPEHVDGQVLLSLFTQEFARQHPVQRYEYDETSDEEEGVIVDRLRDLGYLG